MTNELFTMRQAAKQLDMNYNALLIWLFRHPEFRPAMSFGRSSVWTNEEIEAVRQKRGDSSTETA